jgi:hypothetical protein
MSAKGREQPGSIWRLVGEVAVWLWALGFMGYFYYRHDFVPLIRHLWVQVFG